MMNKKKGASFEKDICNILAKHGFWARLDKGFAQTCDIIASKNNRSYLIECKTCKNDYFNMSRIEDNQNMSRERFAECGNNNAYVFYKLDDGRIFVSKEFINKPSDGIKLEDWLNESNNK